jgi:hypothetical protein
MRQYPIRHRQVIEGYPDWPFRRLGDACRPALDGPEGPEPCGLGASRVIAIAGGRRG